MMDTTNGSFSRTWAELLLAAVILARSTSYVMTKIGLQGMAPFSLLGIRFITAFLFLLPLGWRRLKSASAGTWLRGMLLGTSFFAVMAAEVLGLRTTEASAAAFLENTAIVFVPLLEAVLRRSLPDIPILLSTLVSFSGVALLTLKGGSFSISQGESLCLAAAAFYACTIVLTDRLSRRDDPLALGILQVGFIGLYGIVMAFLFEVPRMPATASEWGVILGLAVVCSDFGFTLQPLAQSGTTSERAGLFSALGPLGAALSGYVFLNERLGATGALGMGLILLGMLFGRRPRPHRGRA